MALDPTVAWHVAVVDMGCLEAASAIAPIDAPVASRIVDAEDNEWWR